MVFFKQKDIIAKLNTYLKLKQRSLTLQGGYCHGLTLLWLYKIAVGQADWFYNITQKIADCVNPADFAAIENDIEYFIAYIEWLQHSKQYAHHINQFDLTVLTELPQEFTVSFLFHHTQLDALLLSLIKENKLICIASHEHTIGLYKRNGCIYLFDAEYPKLQPKILTDLQKLKFEIIRCLFKKNYLPEVRLPLHLFVLSTANVLVHQRHQQNKMLFKQLIESCHDLNRPGLDGVTNMHLACKSGNRSEVKKLLQQGADPNQCSVEDWAPLHVAANNGDRSMARLLMKFGAIATMANQKGIRPVDLAKERGDEKMVKVLGNIGCA